MEKVDFAAIAHDVYAFALSDHPLAGPVKAALQVIDGAFDTWGYVPFLSRTHPLRYRRYPQPGAHISQFQRRKGLYVPLSFPCFLSAAILMLDAPIP